ncbi:hypothetical protein SAMN04487859_109157 [Roseovarius lutimaris]|uniref:Uncharacterized protein n=1 Tax=Roseovarius lutimaris TaxID=1005928 RepID=A0A1I5C823_9RHOB|nr:H-type lectin domain-containing protein [Roseovarius lutimaris]SFN82972.1 hypothetical protein SAMN04487859_109157 [Roseovarius lutimaris]
MAVTYLSPLHVFSIEDLTFTYSGVTYTDNPSLLDTAGAVVTPQVDKDGNVLYGTDSEFGFLVTDFIGAEDKTLDGDFAEGFAGNIFDIDNNVTGLAVSNAATDVMKSGAPLGTWSLGLGGATVKASTEHYVSMQSILSDQKFPGDPDAIMQLDDDLKLLDLRPTGLNGALEEGLTHERYVHELSKGLQVAMANTGPGEDATYSDIDFDRDGVLDTYSTVATTVQATNAAGVVEDLVVGGLDLDNDGTADVVDSFLNGYGGTADLTDLMDPNENSLTYDIAYGQDYSITLKDDGKFLYRWGEAVKRPNDIRMEVNLDLPSEWTEDLDENGTPDSLENGSAGYIITKAELVVNHDITNNPNDQIRPEDYENEAAIGRLPSHYIVTDPDNASNTLWVSPVDSYNGEGTFLPSYFKLDASGNIDLTAGGIAVYDPDNNLVGYRNEDDGGQPIGTVLRDDNLASLADDAELDFSTEDLDEGFTAEWYTTVDREPFEWSYDKLPDNPYANVFESFRTPEDAIAAGYAEDDLVSGPRWRLTPNKFGQDLPGLEIPLEPNSQPPFQNNNIKYETGEPITTTINLLDWDGKSPLASSAGWMTVDTTLLDEDGNGVIDDGWSNVNGTLNAGDKMPEGLVLSAVTPNGVNLDSDFFDTAVYVKGDRQDSAKLYDMQLDIEYSEALTLGTVQQVTNLNELGQTVTFENGASFINPVVFASPVSMNDAVPVTVDFSSVTSTGATLFLEKPDFYVGKGAHAAENVTLLTFEEGTWTLADGSLLQVGEAATQRGDTEVFQSVVFEQAFDEAPEILLQVQTHNGASYDVVRARNVTTTGFEFALQEEEGSDNYHRSEVVGWAAIDAANEDDIVDWHGITGEAFNTGNTVTSLGDEFEFNSEVGTNPLVAASISTYNGPDSASLRLSDLTDDGTTATATFLAQEEESLDAETWHGAEEVTGLAFADSGTLYGLEYVADMMVFA